MELTSPKTLTSNRILPMLGDTEKMLRLQKTWQDKREVFGIPSQNGGAVENPEEKGPDTGRYA